MPTTRALAPATRGVPTLRTAHQAPSTKVLPLSPRASAMRTTRSLKTSGPVAVEGRCRVR
jgi:hypothetical protein